MKEGIINSAASGVGLMTKTSSFHDRMDFLVCLSKMSWEEERLKSSFFPLHSSSTPRKSLLAPRPLDAAPTPRSPLPQHREAHCPDVAGFSPAVASLTTALVGTQAAAPAQRCATARSMKNGVISGALRPPLIVSLGCLTRL